MIIQETFKKGKYNEKVNFIIFTIVLLFSIGTYTLDTFLSSLGIETAYLTITLAGFFVYYAINNTKITIYGIEVFWLLFFLYFLFNMLIHGKFIKAYYVDILAFGFIFIFLLLAKLNVRYFIVALRIMLILSIIYALSTIFQYLNMDLYTRVILPLFNFTEVKEILRLYGHGSYTGFTWQTAFISGYMIFGLGIVVFSYKNKHHIIIRFLMIISIPLMLFSLFLASKRAHLLFMLLSLILTFIFSTETKKFTVQLFKTGFIIITGIIIITLLFSSYEPNHDGQVGKVYNRINETVEGIMAGEDVTTGRIYLYEYATELFHDNFLFGIGWRTFSELSIGIINTNIGSHPHNIYLQLLAELGILGFILFMIPVIAVLIKTIKLLMNFNNYFQKNSYWYILLRYSLYLQFFFLLYGLTGNLLTDRLYLYMYVFAMSITLSAMKNVDQSKLMKYSLKLIKVNL